MNPHTLKWIKTINLRKSTWLVQVVYPGATLTMKNRNCFFLQHGKNKTKFALACNTTQSRVSVTNKWNNYNIDLSIKKSWCCIGKYSRPGRYFASHKLSWKKNPNTISEIRTRDPQIVRAAAIPLDHWGLKECLPSASWLWNIWFINIFLEFTQFQRISIGKMHIFYMRINTALSRFFTTTRA